MLKRLLLLLLGVQALTLHFDQAASLVPHPSKVDFGGEDAFFANQRLLVVADGVGGWKSRGVDSGKFSRALCNNAWEFYQKDQERYDQTPKQLIKASQSTNLHVGSSTMVVLTLDQKSNTLRGSYIGDSRYLLVRHRQIIFQAVQQQHGFNFPFQLASPESKFGSSPSLSLENTHTILNNDILIVGSDGLFDNMFPKQILQVLSRKGRFERGHLVNKQEIADHLANQAIEYGKQKRYISPFAINAHRNKKFWRGGKLDDTTVIIAQVKNGSHEYIQADSTSSTSSDSSTSSSSDSSYKTKGIESSRRNKVDHDQL